MSYSRVDDAAGSIAGMGSRRGGRKKQSRTRVQPADALLELVPEPLPSAAADPYAAATTAPTAIVVSNAFWVQFAVLEPCDVAGCTAQAGPEAWELLDLDTGEEPPGRFCDDHQIAWATRDRSSTSQTDDPAGV